MLEIKNSFNNEEEGMECFTCLTDTAQLLDCNINTDLKKEL